MVTMPPINMNGVYAMLTWLGCLVFILVTLGGRPAILPAIVVLLVLQPLLPKMSVPEIKYSAPLTDQPPGSN